MKRASAFRVARWGPGCTAGQATIEDAILVTVDAAIIDLPVPAS